jgi:hypothetical protein
VKLTGYLHLVPRLRMSGSSPPLPHGCVVLCNYSIRTTFPFTLLYSTSCRCSHSFGPGLCVVHQRHGKLAAACVNWNCYNMCYVTAFFIAIWRSYYRRHEVSTAPVVTQTDVPHVPHTLRLYPKGLSNIHSSIFTTCLSRKLYIGCNLLTSNDGNRFIILIQLFIIISFHYIL